MVNGVRTYHVWDRGNVVLELNASGVVTNRFDRGIRGELVRSLHHGWYLHDGRGSVVQRVNDQGTLLRTYRYSAFGNEVDSDQNNSNPWRFNGEMWDSHRGEYYLRARSFSPRTGRFTQPDPLFHARHGNLQSCITQAGNLFMFVMHNPVRWVDPTGLSATKPGWSSSITNPFSNVLERLAGAFLERLMGASTRNRSQSGPIPIQNEMGGTPINVGGGSTGIVLSPTATPVQIGAFDRAIAHLNRSGTFQSLWQTIHATHVTFPVVFIDDDDPLGMRFNPRTRTIYWNPREGLVMTNGGVQSAALGLAHEMGHAMQYLEGQWIGPGLGWRMTRDALEADVLARFENPIARELGEPTRAHYGTHQGIRTMNNSTHFITVYSIPLRERIMQGIRSRQHTRHHNF